MELKVKRTGMGTDYTIGMLYVDNKHFCETLEDTDRGLNQGMTEDEITNIKLAGKTAIPTGTYNVTIANDVVIIENVKGFGEVTIKTGNRADQTEGCLLVGHNKIRGKVCVSVYIFKQLVKMIQEADTTTLHIQ